MKRIGVWVLAAFLTSAVVGCGDSVQEGMPKDAASANPQPADFQKQMEAQGKFMTNSKKKPAGQPTPAAKPE